jgi:hypothetical protein
MTHLFWAQLMGATLKVTTYQRKGHNVTILSRKLQTHVELIFKYLVVETDMKTERNFIITTYRHLVRKILLGKGCKDRTRDL